VQIWPDGAKYEGNWIDGKANGRGNFIFIKESSFMSMETYTTDSGKMTKLRVTVNISILTEQHMKGSG